jgi:hypothetical protein
MKQYVQTDLEATARSPTLAELIIGDLARTMPESQPRMIP